jgi:hypothetical protein
MRWAEHVASIEEMRSVYKIVDGEFWEKRQLGKLKHRWENNIKMELGETGC